MAGIKNISDKRGEFSFSLCIRSDRNLGPPGHPVATRPGRKGDRCMCINSRGYKYVKLSSHKPLNILKF